MKERRLKITLAYDGGRFAGWQKQPGDRSVQGILEEALRSLFGRKITVVGASRTDSGVHAEGQVAHAIVPATHPPKTILKALNALLPEDVAILSVQSVGDRFHAMYSARRKLYRYTIWNRPVRPVLDRERVVHVPAPLNLAAMQRAARTLRGKHDFKCFNSVGSDACSTMRDLKRLAVTKRGGVIRIEAEADGFLYHMVRRIAGLLLEIGRGKLPPEAAKQLLAGRKDVTAPTAPAKGLCLIRVGYGVAGRNGVN